MRCLRSDRQIKPVYSADGAYVNQYPTEVLFSLCFRCGTGTLLMTQPGETASRRRWYYAGELGGAHCLFNQLSGKLRPAEKVAMAIPIVTGKLLSTK